MHTYIHQRAYKHAKCVVHQYLYFVCVCMNMYSLVCVCVCLYLLFALWYRVALCAGRISG